MCELIIRKIIAIIHIIIAIINTYIQKLYECKIMFFQLKGSWTKQLQNRFRNIRRRPRSHSTGLAFTPPNKKRKPDNLQHHGIGNLSMEVLDNDTYESNIKQLQRQLDKHIKNKAAISSLMSETAPNRRKWILEERPSIHEVTNKFPALKDFDMVHTCI